MTQALAHHVAVKLLDRIDERRKRCSHDVVAEALDEVVDAIAGACAEDIGGDPGIRDLIDSHLRAHSGDHEARSVPVPPRPGDSPSQVIA